MQKDLLVVITARGGSKGLPGKNIKPLQGKPLILYSVDIAKQVVAAEDICVSTDDEEIKKVVEDYGVKVPFMRPAELASDTATSNDVLLHAVEFYRQKGIEYKRILLLQPTSPLRKIEEVREALQLYREDCDMVVSVTKSHAPFVLCDESPEGYVNLVYNKSAGNRQSMKPMYEYNGAIFVINVESLKQKGLAGFDKKIKYVMPKESSIDIDDIYDFYLVEAILKQRQE